MPRFGIQENAENAEKYGIRRVMPEGWNLCQAVDYKDLDGDFLGCFIITFKGIDDSEIGIFFNYKENNQYLQQAISKMSKVMEITGILGRVYESGIDMIDAMAGASVEIKIEHENKCSQCRKSHPAGIRVCDVCGGNCYVKALERGLAEPGTNIAGAAKNQKKQAPARPPSRPAGAVGSPKTQGQPRPAPSFKGQAAPGRGKRENPWLKPNPQEPTVPAWVDENVDEVDDNY